MFVFYTDVLTSTRRNKMQIGAINSINFGKKTVTQSPEYTEKMGATDPQGARKLYERKSEEIDQNVRTATVAGGVGAFALLLALGPKYLPVLRRAIVVADKYIAIGALKLTEKVDKMATGISNKIGPKVNQAYAEKTSIFKNFDYGTKIDKIKNWADGLINPKANPKLTKGIMQAVEDIFGKNSDMAKQAELIFGENGKIKNGVELVDYITAATLGLVTIDPATDKLELHLDNKEKQELAQKLGLTNENIGQYEGFLKGIVEKFAPAGKE